MLKRTLLLAAIAFTAMSAPAAAQYVNNTTEVEGTVSAQCFQGVVTFVDDDGNVLGTAPADDGIATFTLPGGAEADSVTATGTGCDDSALVLSSNVTRTPVQTAPEALPRTGSDSSVDLGRIGLTLVAAGGATLFLARRRQLAKSEV